MSMKLSRLVRTSRGSQLNRMAGQEFLYKVLTVDKRNFHNGSLKSMMLTQLKKSMREIIKRGKNPNVPLQLLPLMKLQVGALRWFGVPAQIFCSQTG